MGFVRRFLGVVGGVVLVCGLSCPAFAADGPPFGQCTDKDLSTCDSDGDNISNAIEIMISGTATGATGQEDTDGDGLPDWVEIEATGTKTDADPTADSAGTGIPDYAYLIVCGKVGCDGAWDDEDADNIPNWVEVVICGTVTCATGLEDYNHDGRSDAAQLIACAKPLPTYTAPAAPGAGRSSRGWLVLTGAQLTGVIVAAAVLLVGGVVVTRWAYRRRRPARGAGQVVSSGLEG